LIRIILLNCIFSLTNVPLIQFFYDSLNLFSRFFDSSDVRKNVINIIWKHVAILYSQSNFMLLLFSSWFLSHLILSHLRPFTLRLNDLKRLDCHLNSFLWSQVSGRQYLSLILLNNSCVQNGKKKVKWQILCICCYERHASKESERKIVLNDRFFTMVVWL